MNRSLTKGGTWLISNLIPQIYRLSLTYFLLSILLALFDYCNVLFTILIVGFY